MLNEVDAQHPFQSDGRASFACPGVVRGDFFVQLGPRHEQFHLPEKFVAPSGFAVGGKARTLIGGHGQSRLFHHGRSLTASVGK